MEKFDGRHVCMSDLLNYLKKDEYLDGYTEPEQLQVRANIGAIGKDDISDLIEQLQNLYILAPYAKLEELVNNSELKVGYRYAIKDFATVYMTDTVHTSSNSYIVILTAISQNRFDPRVTILSDKYQDSDKWIVEFEFKSELIGDISTKGKITYLRDSNNNSAYYDFKSIKFRRSREELSKLGIDTNSQYLDLYTFNTSNLEEASESVKVKNNQFDKDCFDNVFIGNNVMNNIFKAGFRRNTFTNICQNNTFGFDSQDNLFKDAVIYLQGSMSNMELINKNYTNNPVAKQINRSNEGYVLSYLDPDTLATQIIPL